jgi:hypothetical protein
MFPGSYRRRDRRDTGSELQPSNRPDCAAPQAPQPVRRGLAATVARRRVHFSTEPGAKDRTTTMARGTLVRNRICFAGAATAHHRPAALVSPRRLRYNSARREGRRRRSRRLGEVADQGVFWQLNSRGTIQRLLEACCAALEPLSLLDRHVRVQNLNHAVPSDHAGKR